ncbi:MAG: hypothetical protein EBR67_10025 [Proteobacteria bacterium]|nr:hypothetical protein [Pseudomonadota bacterium]
MRVQVLSATQDNSRVKPAVIPSLPPLASADPSSDPIEGKVQELKTKEQELAAREQGLNDRQELLKEQGTRLKQEALRLEKKEADLAELEAKIQQQLLKTPPIGETPLTPSVISSTSPEGGSVPAITPPPTGRPNDNPDDADRQKLLNIGLSVNQASEHASFATY